MRRKLKRAGRTHTTITKLLEANPGSSLNPSDSRLMQRAAWVTPRERVMLREAANRERRAATLAAIRSIRKQREALAAASKDTNKP